jgi:hypothetical protein
LEYLTLDGVILKRVLKKWKGTTWSGFIWLMMVMVVAGYCEGADEFLGSLECGDALDKRGYC